MPWSTLWFGNYKGKTLPQIMFSDPDWFFWALQKGVFKDKGNKLLEEVEELNRKSRKIRIPQTGLKKLVAEYAIHGPTRKFGGMEIVPDSQPRHLGSTSTFRKDHIDLSVPTRISSYDKTGSKLLLSYLKFYLFGNKSYRMTKAKCEAFFEDENNFDL
jgi:hypothetical protein